MDDLNAALQWAVGAFQSRNDRYHVYRSYLNGDQPLAFATEKFREAFGGLFSEFAYNLCETIVDAHTDRMEVAGFASNDEQLAKDAKAIWDMNDMDDREGQVEAEQFGMGDGYVIVDLVDNKPVIWPQLATEVRVRYSSELPGKRDLAARLWAVPGGPWRLNVYTPEVIAKFVAPRKKDETTIPTKPEVFALIDDESAVVPTPVPGIVPVFHFGNNAPVNDYGKSELANIIPLQNGLNKTVMDLIIAMEFTAFPQRYLLGIELAPDDEEGRKRLQQFEAGIQRLLTIRGAEGDTVTAGEFGATNMAQYTTVIEQFEKKISTVSKVPKNYLGLRASDYSSGESKRMDETQFIKKIEKRQAAAGSVWSQVMEYALMLAGKTVKPGDIRVNWESAAPISEDERIQTMLNKKAAGYPLVARLREAGYDPTQIKEIMQEIESERDAQRAMFDMGVAFPLGGAA